MTQYCHRNVITQPGHWPLRSMVNYAANCLFLEQMLQFDLKKKTREDLLQPKKCCLLPVHLLRLSADSSVLTLQR